MAQEDNKMQINNSKQLKLKSINIRITHQFLYQATDANGEIQYVVNTGSNFKFISEVRLGPSSDSVLSDIVRRFESRILTADEFSEDLLPKFNASVISFVQYFIKHGEDPKDFNFYL